MLGGIYICLNDDILVNVVIIIITELIALKTLSPTREDVKYQRIKLPKHPSLNVAKRLKVFQPFKHNRIQFRELAIDIPSGQYSHSVGHTCSPRDIPSGQLASLPPSFVHYGHWGMAVHKLRPHIICNTHARGVETRCIQRISVAAGLADQWSVGNTPSMPFVELASQIKSDSHHGACDKLTLFV